jgi:uncharacterized protein with HEPN domain
MNANDRIRVRHMLDAAKEALSFVQGRTREDLRRDRLLALALIKEIEIVGEAAAKISPEFKQSQPSIPWAEITGMRNRLIHAYFDVNFDVLWDTVTTALDPLILQLESLMGEPD